MWISVVLCILIIPVIIYFIQQVPGKIAKKILEKRGINLDEISDSQQFDKIFENASWDYKTNSFLLLLDERSVEKIKTLLYSLEKQERDIIITEGGKMIRRYREEMPTEEWNNLKNRLNEDMINSTKRYYLLKLTPEQRKELHPIVDEIMKILEAIEK
jgi:hypothetical protein